MTERIKAMLSKDWAWPAIALAASLAMLGAAHAFQHFGGLPPCPLCLKQRDVYWAAAAAAALGLVIWRVRPQGGRFIFALHVLLGLVFATGAVVAGFHAGGEWGWWALPASCTGSGAIETSGSLLDRLGEAKPFVSCEEAAWRLLGISMAGYNALVSAGLAVLSFVAAAGVYRRAVSAPAQWQPAG